MLVSIHLVARLCSMPVLRIDGDIVLLDDDRLGHTLAPNGPRERRRLTAGRLLALAEAELAAADDRRQTSTTAPAGPRRVHPRG